MRYSDEIIDEIRNSNDIVDIISQYVTLKKSGRTFFGLCPFHKEKSPSFAVSPDKQIFHCFGCGVGGNVFHFISKIENINFKETVEMLAERANIELPKSENSEEEKREKLKARIYEINKLTAQYYHENLYKPTAKLAQDYVKKRKLDNNTLKSFQIGFAGTKDELYQYLKRQGFTDNELFEAKLIVVNDNGKIIDRFRKRLMFPIKDLRDRVIAFGGRVLDDSKPKYINSSENIVYNKGRHLFGLNLVKKENPKKIIIVEGYMDAISLYQRGVKNAVASLGTALTEAQGRLLRKMAEQVIIGYDADGAGQVATMRGLEILNNLGCDLRILQIEGAKDPDEFVIKYGPERFNKYVDNAISLVEFKVKTLRKELDINNTSDRIKFLNEIAKILSKVNNDIEKEVYVDKISSSYEVSKEAIYAEINKITYKNINSEKHLEKKLPVMKRIENKKIDESIIKRENMVIYLLINNPDTHLKIKEHIATNDIKDEKNKKILEIIYNEYGKGNINPENVLNWFEDEEIINHITWIMAYDFEINDINKCLIDLFSTYQKEKMIVKRNEILRKIEQGNMEKNEVEKLENELNQIILKLARIK